MQCLKEKSKRTNNDLQNTSQKTKDRASRITLKPEDEVRCSGSVSSFRFTCGTRCPSQLQEC
jgi:hypothetical protein